MKLMPWTALGNEYAAIIIQNKYIMCFCFERLLYKHSAPAEIGVTFKVTSV